MNLETRLLTTVLDILDRCMMRGKLVPLGGAYYGMAGLLAAVLLAGCGSGGGPKTYPLQVRLTSASGQPLPDVSVIFECSETNTSATGATDSNGVCALSTTKLGDGVTAGTHRVSVYMQASWADKPDRKGVDLEKLIPARCADPSTSGLEFAITKDGPRNLDIQLPAK